MSKLRLCIAVTLGTALAIWFTMTIGGFVTYIYYAQKCALTSSSVGCRVAGGARVFLYLGSIVVIPALAVVSSWLVHRFIKSSSTEREQPLGVKLGIIFIAWEGISTLSALLMAFGAPSNSLGSMGGAFKLLLLVMSALALFCAWSVWRRTKWSWHVSVGYLAASIALSTLLQAGTASPARASAFLTVTIVGKLLLLVYLIAPKVRQSFVVLARARSDA